jgi:hypothetical protein
MAAYRLALREPRKTANASSPNAPAFGALTILRGPEMAILYETAHWLQNPNPGLSWQYWKNTHKFNK